MAHYSEIQFTILRLLAECGRLSRRGIDLTGFNYSRTCEHINRLIDNGSIRQTDRGRAKSYCLNKAGRQMLEKFNRERFTPDLFEMGKQLSRLSQEKSSRKNMRRSPYANRSTLRGDVAAALSLAGFSVCVSDKPPLPAVLPGLPENPANRDWMELYQNYGRHGYEEQAETADYLYRDTPVNSYYDAVVLKGLAADGAIGNEGVNYSRACGVLLAPGSLLRVYHARDVAFKFSRTGERNFFNFIRSRGVFSGGLPKEDNGVLIFGDDFTAALKIIDNQLAAKKERPKYYRSKEEMMEMVTATNLGNPAFYLPLKRCALELLSMTRFPLWRESLARFINQEYFDLEDCADWTHETAEPLGARRIIICANLELPRIAAAFRRIRDNPHGLYAVVCLDWQAEFFDELIWLYGTYGESKRANVRLVTVPEAFMERCVGSLEAFWGGGD